MRVSLNVFVSFLAFSWPSLLFFAIELLNVPLIAMLCRVNPKVSDKPLEEWKEEEGGREGANSHVELCTDAVLPFDV